MQHPPLPPPPHPIVSHPTTPRTACSRLCARCCVFLPFSFLSHSSDILAPSSEEGCREPPTAEAIVGLTAGNSFATTPPPHPPKYFSLKQWHAVECVSHPRKHVRKYTKTHTLSLKNAPQANIFILKLKLRSDCFLSDVAPANQPGTRTSITRLM